MPKTNLGNWILGTLTTVCLAVSAYVLTSTAKRMDAFEVGAVERTAAIAGLRTDQAYNSNRLVRIEDKIDKLFEVTTKHIARDEK